MGHLVQIEVANFKSYRGHHVIGPFKQFTAVIGPNGAGKSNLMDAISFVLGVQSSHLRSTNLKELIYRGRAHMDEHGNPVSGATESATSASVAAIYEDDQGRTITFTRTISGDGSSDYRINDRSTRRDAYVAVLERENILVKARNFLVFQGDVETVASQNPKDLTRLIEQVSGSLELKPQYDKLKTEMEKALDESTDMYQKRKTVQAELRSYREQKEEADKYDSLEVEQSQLLLDHSLWRLYHLEKDLAQVIEAEQNVQETRKELVELESTINQKINESKQAVAAAVKDVTHAERRVRVKENERVELMPTLAQFQQQLTHAEMKRSKLNDQVSKVDRDLDKATDTINNLDRQLADLNRARHAINESVQSAKSQRQALEVFRGEYERAKSQYLLLSASISRQLDSARIRTKASQDRRIAAETQRDSVHRKLESLEPERNVTQETLTRAREALEKATSVLSSLDQEIAQVATAEGDLRAREQQLEEKLTTVNIQLMEYSQDQRASQREKAQSELVNELKALFPGVHGRLTEVCRPSQKKYEHAIAAVIGRHLDAIVTDSQATAIECIRYMRENRKGHMQFLPLADLIVKDVPTTLRMFPHARAAIDVITYSPDVAAAVKYACGTSLIADSLPVARHICYDLNTRVKCVTLDGIIIQKGGGMTGTGSTGSTTVAPSRWDEQDITRLREAREQLHTSLLAIKKERRQLAEKESPISQRPAANDRVRHTTDIVVGLEAKLQSQDSQLGSLRQHLKQVEDTLSGFDEEMSDAEVADLENQLITLRDQAFASFCERAGVPSADEYERIVIQSTAEELQEIRRLDAQYTLVNTRRQYESEQKHKIEQRRAQIDDLLAKESGIISEVESNMSRIQTNLNQIQTDLNELIEKVNEVKSVRDEKSKALGKAKSQLAEVRKELESVDKSLSDYTDQKVQLHYTRLQLLRRARVKAIPIRLIRGTMASLGPEITLSESQDVSQGLEIDYSNFDDDLKEDGSEDMDRQFNERLRTITDNLNRLAPNRRVLDKMSIVANKAKQTDKEFENIRRTAKQAKDLFESVRAERYARFMDAYQHIVNIIDKVYKDLTRSRNFPLGGTAYLSLESEEDPFSVGIKYHAMPPMKRFRDMEQLSGGEKTVAAMALLFSINSYRPSPFFVLDEVDAALDNANVAKIARYVVRASLGTTGSRDDTTQLQSAIPKVQFLVISLKNSFYERAQALVGVYRDNDHNTSGVLTLDLEQYHD